jgi:hypothetical protein
MADQTIPVSQIVTAILSNLALTAPRYQVIIRPTPTGLDFSTPQDIAPVSSPVFAGLTLGVLNAVPLTAGLTPGSVLGAIDDHTIGWATVPALDPSPTFTGLTLTGFSGVLKAAAGVVAGSAVHDDLGGVTTDQHHAEVHALAGMDHTASGLTAGNALVATGTASFAWGQVDHLNLAHIGSNTHAQLDTALTRLANTSGTNTGDQTLGGLGGAPTSRLLSTTAPLAGGGDLSANRTLSLLYTANLRVNGSNQLDTAQDIGTGASPTFAGLTLGALAGYVKATAGVLSAGAIADADLPATLVRTSRALNTTAPLTGGGDLSANRSLSLQYSANLRVNASNQLDTVQDIGTGAQPTFAGLTVGALAGYVKATAGVLSAGAIADADLPATLVRTSRAVNTTAPLTGGGDLSADRTLALSLTANLKVTNGNLDTAQGIQTTSSPSFAGLTVGTLSGVLKATAGAVAGSAVHADLGSIGANDHHNQQHVLAGADHTASGLTTGNALLATGATTFAWGQVDHVKLANIGSNTHAQIDTALTRLAGTSGTNSGTNTGDQTLASLGAAPASRLLSTTAPLAGGGDLSANRSLSLQYAANLRVNVSNQLDTVQDIGTGASPTFAGLTLGALAGYVKATAGVLSAGAIADADVPTTLVRTSTTISTTAPLSGGGALSANRTLTLNYTANLRLNGTQLDTVQAIGTGASPVFAGMTLGALAGYVKAVAGVLSAGSIADADLPTTILRTSRAVNTSAPLTGGGALAADLSLGLNLAANLKLTSGALDTVQPIGTSSLVQFGELTLSGTLGGLVVNSGDVGTVLQAFLLGENTARFAVARDGALSWGAGAARDVNLYRGGTGLLKSDNALAAAALVAPSLAPAADATNAVQVLKADGLTPVVTVDTVNNWLGVNSGGPPAYPVDLQQTLTDPTGTLSLLRAYQSATFTADGGPTFRAVNAQVVIDPGGFTLSSGANIAQAVYAVVQITGAGTITGLTVNSAVLSNLGTADVQSAYMYRAAGAVNSGGGTIDTWVGFYVANVTVATTVYGIQSMINAATGRWNLYISGTAINYLAGNLLLGTTTDGMTAGGSLAVAKDLAHRGTKVGFYNTAPAAKPAVTGSRGGNAALASLLTALAGLGLVTDSTSA